MRAAFFLILGLLLAPLAAVIGAAQPAQAEWRAPGVLPLDRILPGIRRTHPGQFYDADGPSEGADGSPHYHLKWMTPDGRIVWLDTDARTGRVLNSSPGRDSFDRPGTARDYPAAPSYPAPDYRDRFRGGGDEDDGGPRWQGG